MNLFNDKYEINIKEDYVYTMNSTDNKSYDFVINSLPKNTNHYTAFELEVFTYSNASETSIVIIGDYASSIYNCAVLKDDELVVLQNEAIIKLNLDSFESNVFRINDTFGTYMAIYEHNDNYIIHGELEIRMIDSSFDTIWTFSVKDIIINFPPEHPLCLNQNYISFYDFDYNYYEIDYNGKLLLYKERNKQIIEIDVSSVSTPLELHKAIKENLGMPDFYGMNWDAFWDGITGLIQMPDVLIMNGWHILKRRLPTEAMCFEKLINKYNNLNWTKTCEVYYNHYI